MLPGRFAALRGAQPLFGRLQLELRPDPDQENEKRERCRRPPIESGDVGEGNHSGYAGGDSRLYKKRRYIETVTFERRFSRTAAAAVVLLLPLSAFAGGKGLVKLKDPLDEPEFYCLDVPGWGRRLNLQAPLMAHTCKPGADDEIFQADYPREGQLAMPAYSLCVQAERAEAGAQLRLKECSADALQRFAWADGRLHPAGAPGLCLAVADAAGEPTGGPSHLRLDLALEPCASVSPARSEWSLP